MVVLIVVVRTSDIFRHRFFNRAARNTNFALRDTQHLQHVGRRTKGDVACGYVTADHIVDRPGKRRIRPFIQTWGLPGQCRFHRYRLLLPFRQPETHIARCQFALH